MNRTPLTSNAFKTVLLASTFCWCQLSRPASAIMLEVEEPNERSFTGHTASGPDTTELKNCAPFRGLGLSGPLAAKISMSELKAIASGKSRGFIVEYQSQPTTKQYSLAATKITIALTKKDVLARTGATPTRDYDAFPLSYFESCDQDLLRVLANDKDVARIHVNRKNFLSMNDTMPVVRQPLSVSFPPFRGSAHTIAVIDTGADWTEPDLGACNAVGAAGCRVVFEQDFAPNDGAMDDNGHGTNVAAIAATTAPGARIAALDVFELTPFGHTATNADILAAINWAQNNQAAFGIVALNLSLGANVNNSALCTNSVFAAPFQAAWQAGIVPVVAAGNDGFKNGVGVPACAPNSVTVGAIYDPSQQGADIAWDNLCTDNNINSLQPTCFSNSHNTLLNIVAPGVRVRAGGFTMSGTSMATPHVAGAVAVLAGVNPTATSNDIEQALLASANTTSDPANSVVTPVLDMVASIRHISPHTPRTQLEFDRYYEAVSDAFFLDALALMHDGGDEIALVSRVIAPLVVPVSVLLN